MNHSLTDFKLDWLEMRVHYSTTSCHYVPDDAVFSRHCASSIAQALGYQVAETKAWLRHDHAYKVMPKVNDVDKPVMNVASLASNDRNVVVSITSTNASIYGVRVLDLLRSLGFTVRIARVDLCYDFKGSFSYHKRKLKDFYKLHDMQPGGAYSYDLDGVKAETLYSHTSQKEKSMFVTLYEKGKERGHSDSDVLRLEFRIRPHKLHKELSFIFSDYVSDSDFISILGISKWATELLSLFKLTVPFTSYKFESIDKTVKDSFVHMVKQYMGVISKLSTKYDLSELSHLFDQLDEARQRADYDPDEIIDDFLARKVKI